MAVQLQWGLEKTAASTLEITTGLIRAATTDNVQPLAILACEQFGSTLAISPEALRKVEHSVLPTPKPAVITFLQSTVGYSANDCASQLGTNTAGLQFLAFTTALITTMGCFESSVAIHEMLASTAKDKTLLPTTRQVRDLLESLEPRCSRASMAADVYGWHTLLHDNLSGPYNWPTQLDVSPYGTYYPSRAGIICLVDALRQLRRIGGEDTDKITIRTPRAAPWTIAFVKWCIGYPPTVMLPNGTTLLEQAGSEVVIEMTTARSVGDEFCVIVHSYIHGPNKLVADDCGEIVAGMVPMRSFGDFLLRRHGFHTGSAAEAFREAIPYALKQVIQRLRCSTDQNEGMLSDSDPRIHFGVSPFPEPAAISQTYHCLFGEDIDLRISDDALDIPYVTRMPLMASYLSDSPGSIEESFAELVASILALSLFDRPDSLHLHISSYRQNWVDNSFHAAVMAILKQGEPSIACTVDSILRLALIVVGHRVSSDHSRWIMSNGRGQTVWPAIYETFAYSQRGFLRLTWLHGILIHRGDVFHQAVSDLDPCFQLPICIEGGHREVTKPLNLFRNLTTKWDVHASVVALCVRIFVKNTSPRNETFSLSPWCALVCLAQSLFLEGCGHPSDSLLERPDLNAEFAGPVLIAAAYRTPPSNEGNRQRKVLIVAVDGDDSLRFAALGTGNEAPGSILLRGDACLACCLETCRRTGAHTLIL